MRTGKEMKSGRSNLVKLTAILDKSAKKQELVALFVKQSLSNKTHEELMELAKNKLEEIGESMSMDELVHITNSK